MAVVTMNDISEVDWMMQLLGIAGPSRGDHAVLSDEALRRRPGLDRAPSHADDEMMLLCRGRWRNKFAGGAEAADPLFRSGGTAIVDAQWMGCQSVGVGPKICGGCGRERPDRPSIGESRRACCASRPQ